MNWSAAHTHVLIHQSCVHCRLLKGAVSTDAARYLIIIMEATSQLTKRENWNFWENKNLLRRLEDRLSQNTRFVGNLKIRTHALFKLAISSCDVVAKRRDLNCSQLKYFGTIYLHYQCFNLVRRWCKPSDKELALN